MLKMELVTIIVPIYKVEQYLERCINSLLRQTYTYLEIILVDDGSPDRCGEICDSYAQKDERIRVIHKQNGGLSSARNSGIELCTGEWIMFVDSDDFIASDTVEYLLKLCCEYRVKISQCGLVRGTCDSFPDETVAENVRVWEFRKLYGAPHRVYSTTAWAKLYDATLFREIRFPYGLINEDEDAIFKVFYTAERIVISNRHLYYYYMSENSILRNQDQSVKYDFVTIFEDRLRWLKCRAEDDLIDVTEKELCLRIMLQYFRAVQFPTQDDVLKLRKLFLLHYDAIRRMDRLPAWEVAALRLFRLCPNAFAFAENKLGIIRWRRLIRERK